MFFFGCAGVTGPCCPKPLPLSPSAPCRMSAASVSTMLHPRERVCQFDYLNKEDIFLQCNSPTTKPLNIKPKRELCFKSVTNHKPFHSNAPYLSRIATFARFWTPPNWMAPCPKTPLTHTGCFFGHADLNRF